MVLTSFCLTFLLFLGLSSSCVPPDCGNPDCGSCGNACCTLEFEFDVPPDQIFNQSIELLGKGGPDKMYGLVQKEDMVLPSVKYLVRGLHTSLDRKDNQTINFGIGALSGKVGTLLKAFSNSDILGSYCDLGQNYKNLVAFVKAMRNDFRQRTISGCTIKGSTF